MNWKKCFSDFPVWFMTFLVLMYGVTFAVTLPLVFALWSFEFFSIFLSWEILRLFTLVAFVASICVMKYNKDYHV